MYITLAWGQGGKVTPGVEDPVNEAKRQTQYVRGDALQTALNLFRTSDGTVNSDIEKVIAEAEKIAAYIEAG